MLGRLEITGYVLKLLCYWKYICFRNQSDKRFLFDIILYVSLAVHFRWTELWFLQQCLMSTVILTIISMPS